MHVLKKLAARFALALLFALTANAALAGPGNPQNGKDYLTLSKAQVADAGKKIEVVEFFGYFCPHCNAFDSPMADWVRKQGDKIAFRRVHVIFRDSMIPFQQAYIALEAIGKTEQVHGKIFRAIHVDNLNLATDEQILEFLVKQGIDRRQYSEALRSAAVQERVKTRLQSQFDAGIDGVPMLMIDGRFVTSPEILRGSIGDQPEIALHLATFQVMDALLAKVARERSSTGGK
jgi:thiol:disulfide interchange protein DsbA